MKISSLVTCCFGCEQSDETVGLLGNGQNARRVKIKSSEEGDPTTDLVNNTFENQKISPTKEAPKKKNFSFHTPPPLFKPTMGFLLAVPFM